MWPLIVFLAAWALTFGLTVVLAAATPTTERLKTYDLVLPLGLTGAASGISVLAIVGAVSLFNGG